MDSRADTVSASNADVTGSDRTTLVAQPGPSDIEKANAIKKHDGAAAYVLEQGHAEVREVDEEKRLVLTKLDESDDPTRFSTARKWLIVLVISSAALCTTCTSSIVRRPRMHASCISPAERARRRQKRKRAKKTRSMFPKRSPSLASRSTSRAWASVLSSSARSLNSTVAHPSTGFPTPFSSLSHFPSHLRPTSVRAHFLCLAPR